MTFNFKKHYDSVKLFNEIAGNLDTPSFKTIEQQAELIREEVNETILAAYQSNYVGLVDGVADIFVTFAGLLQKLEVLGYYNDSATDAVCENNLTKFVSLDHPDLDRIIVDTKQLYQQRGIQVKTEVNLEHSVMIFKNAETGKILKPSNYKSVNLVDFVPEVPHD